jgi:tetratricopeptide (TPR) repeat protein
MGSRMTLVRKSFSISVVSLWEQSRPATAWLVAGLVSLAGAAAGRAQENSLAQRRWFEARTAHFHTYSCGPTQEVAKLAARLEQFHEAYAVLAGAQAVASPPVVVMAFPDHESLEPFLPVYQGKPANLAAFFSRGSDENLIALSLSRTGLGSLETVFHEYTHLLLRHNELFWPLWLKEGMADIYGTFEVTSDRGVRIGKPMRLYLHLLAEKPLLPLEDLFAVNHDSPEYNERDRQGIFYAESWLLTDYLMLGDNPSHKAHFGQLTVLLRQGQPMKTAFTNAFGTSLPAMEKQLRGYLERGRFEPLSFTVRANLYTPQALATRGITPVETLFRLGDQLMRVGQPETAQAYFERARKLAPKSPLPYEGLGLLAADRGNHEECARNLHEAITRGSTSFLVHYIYAREKLRLTSHEQDTYTRVGPVEEAEIRGELEKSLTLIPDFGPAHHLLGFFELLQQENPGAAEQHLKRAIQLEPENEAYLLTLAQAQLFKEDAEGAKRTLESLRRPYVEPALRAQAEDMLNVIRRQEAGGRSQ